MPRVDRISNGTDEPERACRVCGAPVRPSHGSRPTEYCSARPCAEIEKFRSALESRLLQVEWDAGDDAVRARTRSEMQRLVNLIPCNWQRPRNKLGHFRGP